jgi:hypothetical protein
MFTLLPVLFKKVLMSQSSEGFTRKNTFRNGSDNLTTEENFISYKKFAKGIFS